MARRPVTTGARGEEQSRVLSASLQFSVDQASLMRFQEESNQIVNQIGLLQQEVQQLQDIQLSNEDDPLLAGEVAANIVEVQDEIGTLAERYEELGEQITGASEETEELGKRTEEIAKQSISLKEVVSTLDMMSRKLGGLGQEILGGWQFAPVKQLESLFNLTGMMDKYLRQAGLASEEGRRWALAMDDIEEAQLRIGAVASEALVPFMEQVANLAEKGAGFVEEHPDLIRGIVTAGGILVSAGTLASVLSKGVKMFMDVKGIAAAALQSKAAQTMLKAAGIQATAGTGGVGGAASGLGGLASGIMGPIGAGGAAATLGQVAIMAGSVFVGGELGGKLADALGPLLYGEETWEDYREDKSVWRDAFNTIKDGAASLVGVAGMVSKEMGIATPEAEENIVNLMMGIKNFGNAAEQTADDVSGAVEDIAEGVGLLQADVDAYISHRKGMAATDEKYREDRIAIMQATSEQLIAVEEQYGEQRQQAIEGLAERWAREDEAQAWSNYIAAKRRQRQQAKALEDHLEAMADAEETYQERRTETIEDYQERRAETIENFDEQTEDALKAHQKAMRQAREDYEFRQEEAIRARDAIRYLANLRQYNKDKERREEDFRDRDEERQEDHREALNETRENHREALAEMREAHEEAQEEREEQFQERLEQERENLEFENQIREEELAHRREIEKQAIGEQLADMAESHREQMSEIRKARRERLDELREAHLDEKEKLNQQLADKLFDEMELRTEFYAKMTEDAVKWMEKYRDVLDPSQYDVPESRPPSYQEPPPDYRDRPPSYRERPPGWTPGPGAGQPHRQSGGYVDEGLYALHAGEFVLSAPTTQLAERLAGGSLTQDRITQTMMTTNEFVADMSGWQVGSGVNIGMVQKAAEDAAYRAFTRVMEGS